MTIYVLSYAPAEQALATGRLPWPKAMLDFYVPVQWLIDQTPLRVPLLRWAEVFGLREKFVTASARRSSFWGTTPPWLYALGWAAVGVVCVLGPAWPIRRIVVLQHRKAVPRAVTGE